MAQPYRIDDDYFQKTYAGWLGKNIGIRLGSPIEGWSYDRIRETYGEIRGYLVDYADYAADDDSNGPAFFVRALIDYPHRIDEIGPREMARTCLNYVPDHHGFFWWGGYGVSTEHTAYENLKYGMDAPRSGSIRQNGQTCAEQIGGQIFSDCWGFIAPGNPPLAAAYARKMSCVTHDGEGVYGGMFVAACISAAYTAGSVPAVIEAGLGVIPAACLYAKVVRDVLRFYREDRGRDWHRCFGYIREHYGYDTFAGNCHIIPNAAVMILAMLYGEGDFSRTQVICNMCGWDTDCNAGNVGSILGVIVGIERIDRRWTEPINDLLITSSVIGGLNIASIPQTAELFCRIGCDIAESVPPAPWNHPSDPEERRLHFDFIDSTQAFRIETQGDGVSATIGNTGTVQFEGHRSLEITTRGIGADSEVRVFIKTYYQPSDLHDSRYDPAFTPIAFPGQTLKARLRGGGDAVDVQLFARDVNNAQRYRSKPVRLGEEWIEIAFKIPEQAGGLIKETGLILTNGDREPVPDHPLVVFMNCLRISGQPRYSIDFRKERVEHFGFSRGGVHTEISQFTYLNGLWELDGAYLSGSCHAEGETYTGPYYARDYRLSCTVNPQAGHHHLVNFRVQGAIRSYAFGFYGEDTIALVKKAQTYRVLVSKPFPFEHGKEYRFVISVTGDRFTLSVDGAPMLDFRDEGCDYHYGQVGLTVLDGSHCHYAAIEFDGNSAVVFAPY